MQRPVAQFLVLLMLMPSLVCGMSVCPMSGLGMDVAEESHCGGQAKEQSKKFDNVMMFVDCMGIDIQQSKPASQITEPLFVVDLYADAAGALWAQLDANYKSLAYIRGPPKYKLSFSSPTAIYSATQRVRL